MKILITGGLGHIGSYVIRNLNLPNTKITFYIYDNLISQRYCSIFNIKNNNTYKFNFSDLSKLKIQDLPKVDCVIHLAAKTDAAQSHKRKKEFSKNFKITKNIVSYCIKYGAKLIFASTTSVYGPQNNFVDENYKKKDLNPQSPYANTKLKEEVYIKKNMMNNSYIICRFGTVFGSAPGIRFHTAVNKFCFQSSMGQAITVWSTAYKQFRPYLTLKDLNKALKTILSKNYFDNEVYNILSFNLTVQNIINEIKEYNTKLNIEFVKHPIMNQMSYKVSNKKFLKSYPKFKFSNNFTKEIKEIIKLIKPNFIE